jgi:phage repressor protein C with HTH and peptisase S24 domain
MESNVAERSATSTAPDVIVEEVQGDEMYPEIQAGTLVQIEPCSEVQGGGGTYLVELDGVPVLQKVQRLAGRRLRLFSRNSEHTDTVIRKSDDGWVTDAGHPVDFRVVGRYVEVVEVV